MVLCSEEAMEAVRSLAVEQAYVHDVYLQLGDGDKRRWAGVTRFLRDLEPGSIVADVGCGEGKYAGVNPAVAVLGCDRCLPLARRAHSGLVTLADALALPFREEAFDAALCVALLHHLATRERRVLALRELARVLRIGGRVLITVWAMEQRYGKFESQDVLIPLRRVPRSDQNEDTTSDEDVLIYHAYTDSDSKDESPNESCYGFVRRAFQKLIFSPSSSGLYSCRRNTPPGDRPVPIELHNIEPCEPPLVEQDPPSRFASLFKNFRYKDAIFNTSVLKRASTASDPREYAERIRNEKIMRSKSSASLLRHLERKLNREQEPFKKISPTAEANNSENGPQTEESKPYPEPSIPEVVPSPEKKIADTPSISRHSSIDRKAKRSLSVDTTHKKHPLHKPRRFSTSVLHDQKSCLHDSINSDTSDESMISVIPRDESIDSDESVVSVIHCPVVKDDINPLHLDEDGNGIPTQEIPEPITTLSSSDTKFNDTIYNVNSKLFDLNLHSLEKSLTKNCNSKNDDTKTIDMLNSAINLDIEILNDRYDHLDDRKSYASFRDDENFYSKDKCSNENTKGIKAACNFDENFEILLQKEQKGILETLKSNIPDLEVSLNSSIASNNIPPTANALDLGFISIKNELGKNGLSKSGQNMKERLFQKQNSIEEVEEDIPEANEQIDGQIKDLDIAEESRNFEPQPLFRKRFEKLPILTFFEDVLGPIIPGFTVPKQLRSPPPKPYSTFCNEKQQHKKTLHLNLKGNKSHQKLPERSTKDSQKHATKKNSNMKVAEWMDKCEEDDNAQPSCSQTTEKVNIRFSENATKRQPLSKRTISCSSDSSSQESGGSVTYHRYFHVFRQGELDSLIERYVENLDIICSFYEQSSWCIIAEKVHVWTI